ncbi:MAG: DNA mismatch repair protein MutS [Erysipelotrichia bacterium]|nr:DNA mismatch repair protein MutS [Erysipelotrichia bacterium]NCC54752.1 DNA mismatch repair protein MutS [Erysipelotrichia bacterium]
MADKKYTPMMMQYLEVKKDLQDCIVFYRLGDFYEMFFEDATTASNELDLVLTGRNAGVEEKVAMCGIPYHAASGYIQRLTQKGYKVAIVEQLEDACAGKIVKRDVVKIVTPGTIMEEVSDEKDTVYIAAISDYQYGFAISFCEMTCGEVSAKCIEHKKEELQKTLLSMNIREVVVSEQFDKKYSKVIEDLGRITISHFEECTLKKEYAKLVEEVEDHRILESFARLTNYLDHTQKRSMAHLGKLEIMEEDASLQMDFSTKQNLELVSTLRTNSKSQTLWDFLDEAKSSMGSRMLKKWILYPLIDKDKINERLDVIEYLNFNFILKDELKEYLSHVYDLERLSARIAYGSATPRDILRLVSTLKYAPMIVDVFRDCNAYEEFHRVDTCHALYEKIEDIIVENPPMNLKEGGVFKEGYHQELDACRKLKDSGRDFILALEAREKERTGISSLKVGYNRIFGYYIEVRKANIDKIKDEFQYERKQTLANAERFVTAELKEQEEAILHAQEKAIRLENELYNALLEEMKVYLPKLHDLAKVLASMDALYALSVVSNGKNYVRPTFHEDATLQIIEARHPILDAMMKVKGYVANSLTMNEEDQIMMITGPNMGGKSTYMRQTALIVIMAQIGCFVPAQKVDMPVFDKIFTRIGASDDIMSGQSTFMVEMMEANYALQNASDHSLILFDEIGRGTSTYDGMSLAQAMLEYIHEHTKAKTLFSTHYHELTTLEERYTGIKNLHVEVEEQDDNVTFLYRIKEGKADKSYGINVARLAKLPENVLARAQQILNHIQKEELDLNVEYVETPVEIIKENPNEKEVLAILKQVDINQMTPMNALQLINELKGKMNQ